MFITFLIGLISGFSLAGWLDKLAMARRHSRQHAAWIGIRDDMDRHPANKGENWR